MPLGCIVMANAVYLLAPLVTSVLFVVLVRPSAKRAIDVGLVLLGLLAIWPVMVLVAIAPVGRTALRP